MINFVRKIVRLAVNAWIDSFVFFFLIEKDYCVNWFYLLKWIYSKARTVSYCLFISYGSGSFSFCFILGFELWRSCTSVVLFYYAQEWNSFLMIIFLQLGQYGTRKQPIFNIFNLINWFQNSKGLNFLVKKGDDLVDFLFNQPTRDF